VAQGVVCVTLVPATSPDDALTRVESAESPARRTRLADVAWGVVGQLLQLVIVLVAVSFLTFLLLNALPGSAADARIGPLPNFSPDERAELRAALAEQMGLDKPLLWQYFVWVKSALSGDLGLTYQGLEVTTVVSDRLGPTLELGLASIVISVVGSLAISLLAFRTRFRVVRGAIQAITTLLLVMPAFWFGLLLVILFAVNLGWLPSAGYVPWSDGITEHLEVLVMPALTLALPQLALFFRYLNAGLHDTAGSSFVTAARSRGLGERSLTYRHVLPNAALPTVTVIGLVVGSLISGLVIVESVFSWPGLGLLLVDSVKNKDYNTVAAIVLITATTYVIVAFVVDVLYRVLDPRTRRAT
jgi:peptide/nickel transport system permease protein